MDKFIVEYRVSRRGFISGKAKDGREWKKTAYRGAVVDGFGHVFDCDAESSLAPPKPIFRKMAIRSLWSYRS